MRASRIFAGPRQYPPVRFAAYGIVAFPERATSFDRDRHLMICAAYLARLPHAATLAVPIEQQMVTVWPIDADDRSDRLNASRGTVNDTCREAVDRYGHVAALQALQDARRANPSIGLAERGPFLLAWSPGSNKGHDGALVLVSDLSNVTTYEGARAVFARWASDIEENPSLWNGHWDLDRLRLTIRNWVDDYGTRILAVFGGKE